MHFNDEADEDLADEALVKVLAGDASVVADLNGITSSESLTL